ECHLDLIRGRDLGCAKIWLDSILLEQPGDARNQALNYVVFPLQHCREIELDRAGFDAVASELVSELFIKLTGIQQGFTRDAADIQAGAAKGPAFIDTRGLHTELGRANCRDIAARAAADHDEIKSVRHV